MVGYGDWCDESTEDEQGHELTVLTARPGQIAVARQSVAEVVPTHYTSEAHVARVLERLGKEAAAQFVQSKLPFSKSKRSGDLGEILATEYIVERTGYQVPIRKLRWKDHRNMPMRGDDMIGIARDDDDDALLFLKSEAKSNVNLTAAVVAKARTALDADGGLPSPHALSFVSERLLEMGNAELADAIDDAQLKDGIAIEDVEHLTFVFSGNDPKAILQGSLQNYDGEVAQLAVGLRINTHAQFVREVFEKVIADGLLG